MANWLARAQRLTDQAPASANEVIGRALQLVKAAPTPELERELRDLIGVILAEDTDDERAEALAVALADPVAAVNCFRDLASRIGPRTPQSHDDRRTCVQCANFASRDGRCLTVGRGEQLGFGHGKLYHPSPELLLRCPSFRPLAEDPDQRIGAERWPGMSGACK